MKDEAESDLLRGYQAIGQHLGMSARQAKHQAKLGTIPTFKMGRIVCARRSSLSSRFAQLEAKGGANG